MAVTVILASGGLNSTVAAHWAAKTGEVHLLHADYGQRAAGAQREALVEIAPGLAAKLTTIALPHVLQMAGVKRPGAGSGGGSGTGADTAIGPTAGAGVGDSPGAAVPDTIARVPGLMTVLLGSAVQLAQRLGAKTIRVGTSEAADELENEAAPGQGTPDHRRDFFYLFNVMLEGLQKTKPPIALETPLIDLTRGEIVKLGLRYQAPFDLMYACETGSKPPCGQCSSCQARSKAFHEANLLDPALATAGNAT